MPTLQPKNSMSDCTNQVTSDKQVTQHLNRNTTKATRSKTRVDNHLSLEENLSKRSCQENTFTLDGDQLFHIQELTFMQSEGRWIEEDIRK